MSNFYKDAKTVATGWATITSAGKSTVVSDSMKTANGTSKSDTIKVAPIDHATRRIYSNGGNDFIDISGNYGILWSKATVKSGKGNDSIRIYADVDGIHPATVNIDSGVGNDFVSIYGGNNGFHGGTIGLTTDEKTSVSLNLGDGNDKLFIHGLREKGIDISKVKIAGGKGNDLISIYGGSSGIGGWADYGNATVSIDGGVGADTIAVNSIDNYGDVTITAGTGDVISVGSGTADYFFDSTKKVTINGAVFTAKSKNTSAKITTDSNSITLNSAWNGTVKLQQGQKLTDAVGNVFDTSGVYSIVSGRNMTPQVIRLTDNDDIYSNTSDNKIIYALNGDDSIYNSKLNVSILAGSGNDTVYNQGYDVKIDTGNGNDFVLTDVSMSYGSDNYKNATVFGGDGSDTISANDNRTSLNGGAGSDIISVKSGAWKDNTLQGGLGNDTMYLGETNVIKYSSGDGNDTIYSFDGDDTIKITSGNISNAKLKGNDVVITVGKGSITLKDSKDKEITVIDPKGKKIRFINTYKTKDATDGGGESVGGTGSYKNDTDNVILYGTPKNDKNLSNVGNKVQIYGLAGNDTINNYEMIGGKSTIGDDVTIVGGKGNDLISGTNSTTHIKYEWGDGNDTIWSFNGTKGGGIIELGKNAYFKGASLNGNDVIVNVSDGNIVFREGKNNPFSVVDAKGTTFNVKGSYQLKPYPNKTNVKNSKVIVKYHEGYYGESITGANGSATLEVGDSFIKDNSDNISKVYVFGSNSANIKAIGTPITIYGTDSNGGEYSKIADIINGSVNLHKDKSGRTVIEAANKKNSITVDVVADNVDIIGSDKKDIITSSGKKSYIDSGLGNDSVISSGEKSTVVGGNDADTIKYDYSSGFLQLLDTTVKKAVYKDKDRNEIITTTANKNITLQNIAKTQVITVYGNYGRIEFSGNYGGDPSYYKAEAKKLFEKATQSLSTRIGNDLKSAENKGDNEISDSLIEAIKKDLKFVIGNAKSIPNQVYEKIVAHIADAIKKSSFESITANYQTWLSSVIKAISQLGNTSEKILVNNEVYKIEYIQNIAGGTGSTVITVRKENNKLVEANWVDNPKNVTKVLKNYADSLKNLNKNIWYNVVTNALKDLTGKKRAEAYANYAKNIIEAISENNYDKLNKNLKEAFKTFLKTDAQNINGIKNLIETLPNGKKIKSAVDKYLEFDKAYKSFQTQVKNMKTVANLGDSYAKLQKSYNAMESILNGISSNKMIASNISYFSADNDFAGCEKISKSVSDLWFSDEDTNFSNSSVHIDSITKSDLSDYSLGNVDASTDWTTLTPNDSLTSGLTFSKK